MHGAPGVSGRPTRQYYRFGPDRSRNAGRYLSGGDVPGEHGVPTATASYSHQPHLRHIGESAPTPPSTHSWVSSATASLTRHP